MATTAGQSRRAKTERRRGIQLLGAFLFAYLHLVIQPCLAAMPMSVDESHTDCGHCQQVFESDSCFVIDGDECLSAAAIATDKRSGWQADDSHCVSLIVATVVYIDVAGFRDFPTATEPSPGAAPPLYIRDCVFLI